MVLCNYAMPKAAKANSSIVRHEVKEHILKLKPALVPFIEKDQFGEHSRENPNMHFRNFLTKYHMIKLNGVSNKAI